MGPRVEALKSRLPKGMMHMRDLMNVLEDRIPHHPAGGILWMN